jgi:hypothetical protein
VKPQSKEEGVLLSRGRPRYKPASGELPPARVQARSCRVLIQFREHCFQGGRWCETHRSQTTAGVGVVRGEEWHACWTPVRELVALHGLRLEHASMWSSGEALEKTRSFGGAGYACHWPLRVQSGPYNVGVARCGRGHRPKAMVSFHRGFQNTKAWALDGIRVGF